jgi:hypothetical protein
VRYRLLVQLLRVELALMCVLVVTHGLVIVAAMCVVDVLTMVVLLLIETHALRTNALSPVLWGLVGYVVFGQLPFAMNVFFRPETFSPGIDAESIARTGVLIIVGYRAVLLGIVLTVGKGQRWRETRLAIPPLSIILLIAVAGAAARFIYRNQITGSLGVSYEWYTGFLFACTPVSMCLALAWRGQNVQRPGVRVVTAAVLLLGLLVGLADVSRKDTGAALLPACLGLLFAWRPQSPTVKATAGVVAKLMVVAVCGWLILMGTRALSWSIDNHTPLLYEMEVSLRNRQAQDTTAVMAFVVDTTPRVYPYLYGLTLGSLLPVPRVLWPDRPPAHSYFVGLQWRGIGSTEFSPHMMGKNHLSLSAHVLGEGYANFGYAGAVGVELLFGILIGLYERLLREGRLRALRILCPTLLFFIVSQQRGDLTMSNTLWLVSAAALWGILVVTRTLGLGVRVSRPPGGVIPWLPGAILKLKPGI